MDIKSYPELLSASKKIKKKYSSKEKNKMLLDTAKEVKQIADSNNLSHIEKSRLSKAVFVGYSDRYVRQICSIIDYGIPKLIELTYAGKIPKEIAAKISQLEPHAQPESMNEYLRGKEKKEPTRLKYGNYSISVKKLKNGKKTYTIKCGNLQLRWSGEDLGTLKNDLETLLNDLQSIDLSD